VVGRWYQDPKLARTLSRLSWGVIVGGFVVLTRFDAGAQEPWALLGLVLAVGVLNAPVVYGLRVSQRDSHTKAYRAVVVMLLLRLAATAAVVWLVSR
jgi:hypothetical protein